MAAVKRIEALEIGKDVSQPLVPTSAASSGGGAGGGMAMPGAAGAAGAPGGAAGAQGQAVNVAASLAQQLDERYVNHEGKPLLAADAEPFAEFRMMAVRMQLIVDPTKIPICWRTAQFAADRGSAARADQSRRELEEQAGRRWHAGGNAGHAGGNAGHAGGMQGMQGMQGGGMQGGAQPGGGGGPGGNRAGGNRGGRAGGGGNVVEINSDYEYRASDVTVEVLEMHLHLQPAGSRKVGHGRRHGRAAEVAVPAATPAAPAAESGAPAAEPPAPAARRCRAGGPSGGGTSGRREAPPHHRQSQQGVNGGAPANTAAQPARP